MITFGFFLSFVWSLTCGTFSRSNSRNMIRCNGDKRRIKAVFKMFFVLGPTWIMDVISWALGRHSKWGLYKSQRMSLPFDIINALQVIFYHIKHLYLFQIMENLILFRDFSYFLYSSLLVKDYQLFGLLSKRFSIHNIILLKDVYDIQTNVSETLNTSSLSLGFYYTHQ